MYQPQQAQLYSNHNSSNNEGKQNNDNLRPTREMKGMQWPMSMSHNIHDSNTTDHNNNNSNQIDSNRNTTVKFVQEMELQHQLYEQQEEQEEEEQYYNNDNEIEDVIIDEDDDNIDVEQMELLNASERQETNMYYNGNINNNNNQKNVATHNTNVTGLLTTNDQVMLEEKELQQYEEYQEQEEELEQMLMEDEIANLDELEDEEEDVVEEEENEDEDEDEEDVMNDEDVIPVYPLPPLSPVELPTTIHNTPTQEIYGIITEVRRLIDDVVERERVKEMLLHEPTVLVGVAQVLHECGLLRRPVIHSSTNTITHELLPLPIAPTPALPAGYTSWIVDDTNSDINNNNNNSNSNTTTTTRSGEDVARASNQLAYPYYTNKT